MCQAYVPRGRDEKRELVQVDTAGELDGILF